MGVAMHRGCECVRLTATVVDGKVRHLPQIRITVQRATCKAADGLSCVAS